MPQHQVLQSTYARTRAYQNENIMLVAGRKKIKSRPRLRNRVFVFVGGVAAMPSLLFFKTTVVLFVYNIGMTTY